MRHSFVRLSRARAGAALSCLLVLIGCNGHRDGEMEPGPVLPLGSAIALANANAAGLPAGLQALGSARGHVTVDSQEKRHFDCDANLLVIPPRHLRLDLRTLGQTQVLFGSNEQVYWLHVVPQVDTYWWGRYAEIELTDIANIPIRPDMIVEALGIVGLPTDTTGSEGPFQRVEGEHQQLLFVTYDPAGQGRLYKEYWLSRRGDRRIEQIIFRDDLGREQMRSRLSDYRPLGGDGPLLPHRVDVTWPERDAHLLLRVRTWKPQPALTPEHRAFQPPYTGEQQYKKVVDIDRDF